MPKMIQRGGVRLEFAPTDAQAFVLGDTVMILIPRDEFSATGAVGFRTTALTYLYR